MEAEKHKIPKVLVLGTIAPSSESAKSDMLEYNNLTPAVERHRPYEYERMHQFWDAEPGSLEEQEKASQLAMQYMLMGSQALMNAGTEENRKLWSDRYTQATTELYGTPDSDIARKLFESRVSGQEKDQPFYEIARGVGQYLEDKYFDVYAALDIDTSHESDAIDIVSVADRFEAALNVLKANHDEAWNEWTIEREDEKDSLSVVAGSKKIIVGMRRASMSATQLKGLFSHEVLVHGLRGVNGSKRTPELGTGLPGYLDAEEGLGVFVEYAVTGEVPDKIVDRYIDVAYAAGAIDGEKHTRKELLEYALNRAVKRNKASDHQKSMEDITKEVYAHVNRIYRGSLGNEHVAVFTKDIAYYKGFIDMGIYISAELDQGKTISSVVDYLMSGKFDPMNKQHAEMIS